MSRTCLIVAYHFPPSAASGTFRLLGLARLLPRFGWRPVIVAPPQLPWEPIDHELSTEVPPDTTVVSAPYPTGRFVRLLRKTFGPEPVWLPWGLAAARRACGEHRPDAILTSGPPHGVHLIGWRLKRKHGVPWVADLRDPICQREEMGNSAPRPNRWAGWTERLVLRNADAIISNAPTGLALLRSGYPQYQHKITMATNGFDPERFPSTEPRRGGPIYVVHTGELYAGRDPRTFLDALRLLRDARTANQPLFHAKFLGRNTAGRFDLAAEVKQRDLTDAVTLGGQVSYGQSLADMAGGDILLLLDGAGRRLGVPAKLYEYLGARRPILAVTEADSDSAWVLRISGVLHRIVPPPGDGASIADALLELADAVRSGVMPEAEGAAVFTRAHMAKRVVAVLDFAVGDANSCPAFDPCPGSAAAAPVGVGGTV